MEYTIYVVKKKVLNYAFVFAYMQKACFYMQKACFFMMWLIKVTLKIHHIYADLPDKARHSATRVEHLNDFEKLVDI